MNGLTDEMRAEMQAITANMNHTRTTKSGARYFRHNGGKVVEVDKPDVVASRSMFPYKSTAMAVEPEHVQRTREYLRRHAEGPACYTEFDSEGRPVITSTEQQSDLSTTMGMKTGRDGYGHTDEFGNFQISGRRRNDEIQEGRGRIRKAIKELNSMPEDAPSHVVTGVLDQYDIGPTEDNTG